MRTCWCKAKFTYVTLMTIVHIRLNKVTKTGDVNPQRMMRCFTGPSHDSRYSTDESSADPRLNGETGLPGGRGGLGQGLVRRQNVKVERAAAAGHPC